jgi:hypothetical protein
VVRQEELSNVQSAIGVLRKHMNIPSQWATGQRLTSTGRQEILKAGREIAASQKSFYDDATKMYRRQAEAVGIDPSLFIRELGQPTAAPRIMPPGSAQATHRYDPQTRSIVPVGGMANATR